MYKNDSGRKFVRLKNKLCHEELCLYMLPSLEKTDLFAAKTDEEINFFQLCISLQDSVKNEAFIKFLHPTILRTNLLEL